MFYVTRIATRHDVLGEDELGNPIVMPEFVAAARTPPSTPMATTEFIQERMTGPTATEQQLDATTALGITAETQFNTSNGEPQPSTSGYQPQRGPRNRDRRDSYSGIAPRAEPEDTDSDEFFEAEDHGSSPPSSPIVPCNPSTAISTELTLYSALGDCERALQLFFNNNLDGAISIMTPWKDVSLYHAHGAAIFEFIPAMLTLDPVQIQKANDALRHTFELCSQHRRNYNFVQSIGAIIRRPNYATYTEEEAHAELIHAEAVMLQACIGALENEDVAGLVKASFRIKSSFNSYKQCAKILSRKEWESAECKAHFESGVRLGLATFDVMISLLPPRLITLLEFIGFSANKEKGIEDLKMEAKSPGLRSVLCSLTLLIYYLVIGHFAAIVPDYFATEQMISRGLARYPNSVWFTMFKARMLLLRGMINEAVESYQMATHTENLWPQLKHLCYWEMIWAYGIMMEWSQAAWYASRLGVESKWSRTIYMYTEAAMHLERGDGLTTDQRRHCELLLRKATSYKQRVMGRSLPMEKFVIRRCERWLRRGYLTLPGVELMCLWNMFPSLAAEPHYADRMLKHIEKLCDEVETTLRSRRSDSSSDTPDYDKEDLAVVKYLNGSLLAAMSLPRLALRHLEVVLTMKDEIKDGTHLVPFTAVEIAMCHYALGDSYQAVDILHDARKKYAGYLLEARLQFRIHSKLELINAGAANTVVAGTTASAVPMASVNVLAARPSTSTSSSSRPITTSREVVENRSGRMTTREVLNTIADSRAIMAASSHVRNEPEEIALQRANPGHAHVNANANTNANTNANANSNTNR
ncbi:Tetratricopeptide repeat protein 39B [Danaus plexippus plexippus]|uniref:Tetratricopeptide repeat protein 39B n=1 Tax=Danaus plexippus plexippus TaxID=278856 RepID=A0A212EY10_DANPL|nr:tetratricopeptide repeat protein 39B-like isoform X1 [Danaus plexippus plexippus]OWR46383.1 Tetratricopeptide repeat protein 39B [Danaus plexippus plexippus]